MNAPVPTDLDDLPEGNPGPRSGALDRLQVRPSFRSATRCISVSVSISLTHVDRPS